ncbi:MAG: hypothetical protein ABIW85_07120 [Variovorax sp.]
MRMRVEPMLNRISHLVGSSVTAIDHRIGHVTDAYFDSQSWTIRYLVIDTGIPVGRDWERAGHDQNQR